MRANFFVMDPVNHVDDVAVTYLAAYRAPDVGGFDNALVREFPNITNVDLRATVAQLQRVLDQVIRAVEFLFGFTLAAGLVVLFAAITATREERAREFAIMRAVGARAQLLRQVQRAELAGVGLLAGVLASVVAVAIGWALARYVFDFAWTPHWWVPLAGGACGALLAPMELDGELRAHVDQPATDQLPAVQADATASVTGNLAGAEASLRVVAQLKPQIAPPSPADSATAAPKNASAKAARHGQDQTAQALAKAPSMQADVDATIYPWKPWPVGPTQAPVQSVNLAAFLPSLPTTLLNGKIAVTEAQADALAKAQAEFEYLKNGGAG